MVEKIISGGQSGVDRAALDAAMRLNIPHGGWCPKGRLAELGEIISKKYTLTETTSPEYSQRTELNVKDSDGTLMIVLETPIKTTDGSLGTIEEAIKHSKPYLMINLSINHPIDTILQWIKDNDIAILNIAGPRESQSPGIYEKSLEFINELLCILLKLNLIAGKNK